MSRRFISRTFRWTPELAYVVGLLVTDGNLSKDGRHIIMRSSDIDLLQTFKKCLSLNNKIGQTRNNEILSYRVQFGNVQFYDWLVGIGLFPAKTYTLGEIKVPEEFFRDFLRGHLDGDGSIRVYVDQYNTYRGRNYVNNRVFTRFISASPTHIIWLKEKIKELAGITGALFQNNIPNEKRVAIWVIQFARKESVKLLRWIYYQKDLPCLNRKKLLADEAIQITADEVRKPYSRISLATES